jgi:hypothetical protein
MTGLGFAGIAPARVQTISGEQQFAEKLHAYSLPRISANSRVKDLVDMALLIGAGTLSLTRVAEALQLTFNRRRTHVLPRALSEPPRDWQGPFHSRHWPKDASSQATWIRYLSSGFAVLSKRSLRFRKSIL